ncbi:MAG TPA: helix-turn-helix domain-containing protein [Parvibaculum sp.]|jgi:AcrR family transcriptional regulator
MARAKPAGKLVEIADAALAAFGRTGFRLTQMTDVAKLCDMSAGALYGYVNDKEALFYIAVLTSIGHLDPSMPLPVLAASTEDMLALLQHEIAGRNLWPLLKAALKREKAADVGGETAGIAGELYDLIAHDRRLIRLLDVCGRDIPEIADFFTRKIRGRYFDDFASYLKNRNAAGQMKDAVATPVSARALVEMVAWMAAHRHGEPIPLKVTEEEARRAVQDLFASALSVT